MEERDFPVLAAREEEEVRGRRRFLLFFLFLFDAAPSSWVTALSLLSVRRDRGTASSERSSSLAASSAVCSLLRFATSFSSSSNFLFTSSAEAVRKRSAEESTCSPNAPASTGRPTVGRQSPEKCRRLRSLLCGPGSARMPGRTTGGGVFCARWPVCVTCSSTSLALAPVFGPRGEAFCCALWCVAAARAVRTVCCSCRSHEHSRRSPRQGGSHARLSHHFATTLDKRVTNLVEPCGGGGGTND